MSPKQCIEYGLLLLPMLLWGCAHADRERIPSHKLVVDQQLAASANLLNGAAYRQMTAALDYYIALDDRSGQWHANYRLAQWALSRSENDVALEYAAETMLLAKALADSTLISASAILLGQLKNNDTELFELALEQASTPLDRAIALSLLGRYENMADLMVAIDSVDHPNEKGFLLYRYGKQIQSKSHVEQALQLYQYAGNDVGVVDSLFLVALLETNKSQALDYALRALRSAEVQSDKKRALTIQRWLDQQSES